MSKTDGWSAMKKLKYSILKRAFDQNRGGEAILLIQWRLAQTRHEAQKDMPALKAFEEQNAGQPRALRALNLIEQRLDHNVVHKLTVDEPSAKSPATEATAAETKPAQKITNIFEFLAAVPEADQILVKKRYWDLATMPAFNADHYDPMEGLQITGAYAMAARALAEIEEILPNEEERPEAVLKPDPDAPTLKH